MCICVHMYTYVRACMCVFFYLCVYVCMCSDYVLVNIRIYI